MIVMVWAGVVRTFIQADAYRCPAQRLDPGLRVLCSYSVPIWPNSMSALTCPTSQAVPRKREKSVNPGEWPESPVVSKRKFFGGFWRRVENKTPGRALVYLAIWRKR